MSCLKNRGTWSNTMHYAYCIIRNNYVLGGLYDLQIFRSVESVVC